MSKITVNWEVDDGYVGGSRPQHFKLDIADLADYEKEEDARAELHSILQEEMMQKVNAVLRNEEEIMDAWREARKAAVNP